MTKLLKQKRDGNGTIIPQPGHPIPKLGGRGPKPKYPWLTMKVGDSFLYEGKLPRSAWTHVIRSSAVYAPRKFECWKTPDGVRVWRVK